MLNSNSNANANANENANVNTNVNTNEHVNENEVSNQVQLIQEKDSQFSEQLGTTCFPKGGTCPSGNGICSCASCTSTRIIGYNAIPRFIDEVKCTADRKCSTGFGSCIETTSSVRVKMSATSIFTMDISYATGCICKT